MSILDQFRLDGKVAIVTGATRGLGRAIAIALAEAGADIAAMATRDATETKAEIEKRGRRCLTIAGDIAERGCVENIVSATLAGFKRIDILVNNAGIIRRGAVTEFTEKDWDDVMDVNIRALFFLSQAAAKVMIQQGQGGKIINIASMLSFQGGIRIASYTASKGAVRTLTMLLANELAPHNIQCNAIAPGYMATDNTAPLRADTKRKTEILARIPAGRWGSPEDLQGAAVFLASRASDYVNGCTLAVDGGWLAR